MEHVKGHNLMNTPITSKQHSDLIIETEMLLIFWIEDQNQHIMPINLSLVQEKAWSLFNDLKAAHAASELVNIKLQGEAVSADICAASDFPKS